MGVYELSGAGSVKTSRIIYPTMNANNGNSYGAMVPLGYVDSAIGSSTFINIPQTFQDLRLVLTGAITSGTSFPFIAVNNDGSTAASQTRLEGNGTSATSSRRTGDGIWYFSELPFLGSSTAVGVMTMDILNYANTTTFKTAISRWAHDLNGSGTTNLTVHLKQITAGINRIDFGPNSGPWATYSATLYGIRAVAS